MKLEDIKNIDFKNIDLKSLDYNKVSAVLLGNKELLGQLAVIVIAVMIFISLIGNFLAENVTIRNRIDELNAKKEAIENYEDIQNKMRIFKRHKPATFDEQELSDKITDLASANQVTVLSISQGQKSIVNEFETLTMSLELRVKDFKGAYLFIKALENVDFALRIDAFNIVPHNNPGSRMVVSEDSNAINLHLEFSSVSIKI